MRTQLLKKLLTPSNVAAVATVSSFLFAEDAPSQTKQTEAPLDTEYLKAQKGTNRPKLKKAAQSAAYGVEVGLLTKVATSVASKNPVVAAASLIAVHTNLYSNARNTDTGPVLAATSPQTNPTLLRQLAANAMSQSDDRRTEQQLIENMHSQPGGEEALSTRLGYFRQSAATQPQTGLGLFGLDSSRFFTHPGSTQISDHERVSILEQGLSNNP